MASFCTSISPTGMSTGDTLISIQLLRFFDLLEESLHLAFQEARRHISCNTRCAHFGCVVLRDGMINHVSSNDPDCHAEISATRILDHHQTTNDVRSRSYPQDRHCEKEG